MRTREKIEEVATAIANENQIHLVLEVLLDIRDIIYREDPRLINNV
jgi:hypothetical protein